jgi:hypothetical protein
MPARRHLNAYLCAVLVCSACSSGSELETKIDESPQGAVYLIRITDPSFQAAHPIKIDPGTIALVLSGILIRDSEGASPDVRRAFSGSEVGYLAPLISDGLRRATSDQQVGFRVERGSPRESAVLVLYAYGRSLYVKLLPYRSTNETGTGLANRTVSFIPEAAKRPDSFLDARSMNNTLVIDYELLAMLPPASNVPVSTQSAAAPALPQAANGGKVEPVGKDAEIEELRRELREIKKQLADQEAERARSQPKNAVPPK